MSLIQNMCLLYCSIWIPALVFQRSATISASQRIKENIEKSSLIDYKDISHITFIGSWGYH